MTCDRVRQKLVFYVDGSLGDAEKMEIEQHLKQCNVCAADYHVIVSTIDAARKIEVPEHDEAFWKIQYELTLSRAKQKLHRRTFMKRLRVASGIIGMVLLVFASMVYIEKNKPVNPVNPREIVYSIPDDILSESKIPIPVDELEKVVDSLAPEDHMMLLAEFLR